MRLPALLIVATLLPSSSASAPSYDLLCENIVSHAKAAARAHNAGKAAAAEVEAAAMVAVYRSAVELEPVPAGREQPQAPISVR